MNQLLNIVLSTPKTNGHSNSTRSDSTINNHVKGFDSAEHR